MHNGIKQGASTAVLHDNAQLPLMRLGFGILKGMIYACRRSEQIDVVAAANWDC